MIKTTSIETIERYDKDGKLIEKIVRRETTEDDESRPLATETHTHTYTPNDNICLF